MSFAQLSLRASDDLIVTAIIARSHAQNTRLVTRIEGYLAVLFADLAQHLPDVGLPPSMYRLLHYSPQG